MSNKQPQRSVNAFLLLMFHKPIWPNRLCQHPCCLSFPNLQRVRVKYFWVIESSCILQRSTTQFGLRAKLGLLVYFYNKVLLEHICVSWLAYFAGLLLLYQQSCIAVMLVYEPIWLFRDGVCSPLHFDIWLVLEAFISPGYSASWSCTVLASMVHKACVQFIQ